MEKLGIHIGDHIEAFLLSGPVTEIIPVKEGWTSVRLAGRWEDLRAGTILKGRLLFGGKRVYGRFTEAQNFEGTRTWPVCMELLNGEDKRGVELEPGSTAEAAQVFNSVGVKAVDRFQ
jgi:serine/threonine-protein kinase